MKPIWSSDNFNNHRIVLFENELRYLLWWSIGNQRECFPKFRKFQIPRRTLPMFRKRNQSGPFNPGTLPDCERDFRFVFRSFGQAERPLI